MGIWDLLGLLRGALLRGLGVGSGIRVDEWQSYKKTADFCAENRAGRVGSDRNPITKLSIFARKIGRVGLGRFGSVRVGSGRVVFKTP